MRSLAEQLQADCFAAYQAGSPLSIEEICAKAQQLHTEQNATAIELLNKLTALTPAAHTATMMRTLAEQAIKELK